MRMELQPESDAQAAIVPTQLIAHSIAAPWTPQRIFEYWRDSTNLESHFGLGYDGAIAQYVGTQTRADANMYANRRPDGTGAVSVETASNLQHTDPWTGARVRQFLEAVMPGIAARADSSGVPTPRTPPAPAPEVTPARYQVVINRLAY